MGNSGSKKPEPSGAAADGPALTESQLELAIDFQEEDEPDWEALMSDHPDVEVDVETLRVLWLSLNKQTPDVKKLVAGMKTKPRPAEGKQQKSGGWIPKSLTSLSSTQLTAEQRTDVCHKKLLALEGVTDSAKLRELASALGNPREMQKMFFKQEDCVAWVDLGMNSGPAPSANDVADESAEQTKQREFEALTAFSQSDLEEFQKLFPSTDINVVQKGTMWRVKLVISSIKPSAFQKKFGVLPAFPYGMVHTGLLVGPVVLEWGLEGIVIPSMVQDYHMKHSMMCMDVDWADGSSAHFVSTDQVGELCTAVCKWNVNKNYNQLLANCQQFVEDCLRQLDLKFFDQPGSENLKLFMKQLTKGVTSQNVQFSFQDEVFDSHSKLDSWYDANQGTLSPGDRALLKAYDRAFWLRHLAYMDDITEYEAEKQKREDAQRKKCRPLDAGCPFKDPRTTGTLDPKATTSHGQTATDNRSGSGPANRS